MTDNEKINIEVVELTNFKEGTCTACVEEEGRCPACKVQDIGETYDPDSSDKAWEYYEHVYKDNILGNYTGEPCACKQGRSRCSCLGNGDSECDCNPEHKCQCSCKFYYVNKKKRQISVPKDTKLPDMGGDTMFNFKHDKYNTFEKLLSTDDTSNINQLIRCAKNHHSLLNFSLMPVTGALNSFKGMYCQLDRFDCFIKELSNYYTDNKASKVNTKNELELNIVTTETQNTKLGKYRISNPALVRNNFLNNFESIEDYCKQIYFIDPEGDDKRLIVDLSKNGKTHLIYSKKGLEKLESEEEEKKANLSILKTYMTLAEDYWEMRHKQLQNDLLKSNLCQSCKQGDCNCHHYYYTDRHGISKSYCYHDKCKPK